jgi:hypothetical protein
MCLARVNVTILLYFLTWEKLHSTAPAVRRTIPPNVLILRKA